MTIKTILIIIFIVEASLILIGQKSILKLVKNVMKKLKEDLRK